MARWIVVLSALVACVAAEPPVGYSYSQPSSLVVLGGGHSIGGGLGLSSGHGYRAVSSGYQTSEGQYIDPQLLEEIKHILLKDEIQNQQYRSSYSSFGGGHGLSTAYGPPAPVYGVPAYSEKVVGIELGNVKQGIQVAQYEQDGGYSGGFSSGGYSSGGYSHGGSIGGYSSHGGSIGGYSSHGGSIGGYSLGGSSGHGIALSSGYSAPSISYNTIAIPSGTYGVPLPSSRYGSPRH